MWCGLAPCMCSHLFVHNVFMLQIAHSIAWHPSGLFVFISSHKGEIQVRAIISNLTLFNM